MAEIDNAFGVGIEFPYSLSVIIICILGVVSNILLLVAFIKDRLKCFRNSGTYLVINLSVADCLFCLLSSFCHILPRTASYPIFLFLMNWFPGVSFVAIASVSIDRFLIVACPIKHRILMKRKVLILWTAAIWIVGCIIPVIQTLSNDRNTYELQPIKIFAVIAIMVSTVMYSSTHYTMKKQSRNLALQNSTESRAQQIRIVKEKRFLNTIVIIASIAFVCVVPPMLMHFIAVSTAGFPLKSRGYLMASQVSYSIFFINFAVNPFIYIVRLPNYRKAFYLTYCRR